MDFLEPELFEKRTVTSSIAATASSGVSVRSSLVNFDHKMLSQENKRLIFWENK